jgi:hypothetical protein
MARPRRRNTEIGDGFTEIFNREIGFSHPITISRRISASEVLIFFQILFHFSIFSDLELSLYLFPFLNETFQLVKTFQFLAQNWYRNMGFG